MYLGADICTEAEKRLEAFFMIELIFEKKNAHWRLKIINLWSGFIPYIFDHLKQK